MTENHSSISNIWIKRVPEKMTLSTKLSKKISQNSSICFQSEKQSLWPSEHVSRRHHWYLVQIPCMGPAHPTVDHSGLTAPSSGELPSAKGQLCLLGGSTHHSSSCTGELTPMTDGKCLESCPKRGTNSGTICAPEQSGVSGQTSFQPNHVLSSFRRTILLPSFTFSWD